MTGRDSPVPPAWARGSQDIRDFAKRVDSHDALLLELALVTACGHRVLADRSGAREAMHRAQLEVGDAHLRRYKFERIAASPSPVRRLADEFQLSQLDRTIFLFVVAPMLSDEVAVLYTGLGAPPAACSPRLLADLLGVGVGPQIQAAIAPDSVLVRKGLVQRDPTTGAVVAGEVARARLLDETLPS